MADCPLTPDVLPPNFRKHVEAASPKPLRGMAAKGLVPMAPSQSATALYMLSFDAEADIAEQARATAAKLPDRILATALRDNELPPQVLAFFAQLLPDKEQYLEAICLNPTTSDETIADIALSSSEKLSEIISQNQLRLLRCEPILRSLSPTPAPSSRRWTASPTLPFVRASTWRTSPPSSKPTAASMAVQRRRRRLAPRPTRSSRSSRSPRTPRRRWRRTSGSPSRSASPR